MVIVVYRLLLLLLIAHCWGRPHEGGRRRGPAGPPPAAPGGPAADSDSCGDHVANHPCYVLLVLPACSLAALPCCARLLRCLLRCLLACSLACSLAAACLLCLLLACWLQLACCACLLACSLALLLITKNNPRVTATSAVGSRPDRVLWTARGVPAQTIGVYSLPEGGAGKS